MNIEQSHIPCIEKHATRIGGIIINTDTPYKKRTSRNFKNRALQPSE